MTNNQYMVKATENLQRMSREPCENILRIPLRDQPRTTRTLPIDYSTQPYPEYYAA